MDNTPEPGNVPVEIDTTSGTDVLVAVVTGTFEVGQPEWLWTRTPGSLPPYEVVPLSTALATEWPTDKFFITGVAHRGETPVRYQPRVNKEQIADVRAHEGAYDIRHQLLAADIDTPMHIPITPSQIEAVQDWTRRLTTAGWYTTRAGVRIVQPLTTWLSPERYEEAIDAWLDMLRGIFPHTWVVDQKCRDSTRHFRLPFVRRRAEMSAPTVDLTRMVPIEPPAPRPRPQRVARSVGPSGNLPATDERLQRARQYVAAIPVPECGAGECHERFIAVGLHAVKGFALDEADAVQIVREWVSRSSHTWTDADIVTNVRGASRLSRVPDGYLVAEVPLDGGEHLGVEEHDAPDPLGGADVVTIDERIEGVPAELRGAALEERLAPIIQGLRACGPLERERVVGVIAARWGLRIPVVRAMVESVAAPVGGVGGDDSSARSVIQEVVTGLGLVRDARGVEFVLTGSEAIPVCSSTFAKRIAFRVREERGISVTSSMITDAVLPLLGADLRSMDIPIRVAGDVRRVILDMADGTGRVIVITDDGVSVVAESPVPFLRPPGIARLPEPVVPASAVEARETLSSYWTLMGFADDEAGKKARVGTYSWLMSTLRRATNYTLALMVGGKGTGKTWRARMMRDAVDPYALDVESIPKDLEQLTVCAMSSHAIAYDNVSHVPLEISDGLCSLATGGGRRARKLYTEADAVLFRFARPVILTSVVEAVTEGDLLDRALIIRAPKSPERKSDEKLAHDFADLHPRLIGALAYLVSVAIKNLDTVVTPDDVRMQSAAAFAAAAEEAAGFGRGAVFDAYRQAQEDALAVLAEHPVARAVLDWTAEATFGPPDMKWSGTATELRTILTDRVCGTDDKGRLVKREPKFWPSDARGLSSALRRLAPTLAAMGADIEFATEGSGLSKHRAVVVTKRDAGRVAAWDANLDLESTENMSTGTHGTLGTQKFPVSPGSPNNMAIDILGVDAHSLSPLKRERSVPSVPCVPAPKFLEQNVGRKIEASVPCVPVSSVPHASQSADATAVGYHDTHSTHDGAGVVALEPEVPWIIVDLQDRPDGRYLLLVDIRANRRTWIRDPSSGALRGGTTLTGIASLQPDASLTVAVTGLWSRTSSDAA